MKNLKFFPYERNEYFYGKLMSVNDFQIEQKYMNDKRRLINRLLHGCGVVCGLSVVQIDDCTLSLEAGVALDFTGREIVVAVPITKKLSMIDGFTSYTEEDENNRYLYLCIEYAEKKKEPVYNVAGAVSEGTQFNKVAESYRIYLTSQEPKGGGYIGSSFYEESKIIYWGSGIRISQIFPKYVRSGEKFQFRVVVENMGQKLPVWFAYELFLDSLEKDGNDRILIEFDEKQFEKARRYEFSVSLKAAAIKGRTGQARLKKRSFQLKVGEHQVRAEAEYTGTTKIVEEEVGTVLKKQYYEEAMEQVINDTDRQNIYLAKISVIRAGSTFVIDRIEQMPFDQYIQNEMLSAALNRIQKERIGYLEQLVKEKRKTVPETGENLDKAVEDTPQMAAGAVVLELGIGGLTGQKFFSQEITHGLGLGNVRIILGEASGIREDSSVIYGAADIFEDASCLIKAETAARVDVTKGTFVIGLKLQETTTARQAKIYWMALKDRKEKVYDRESRELFVKPDMVYLNVRESCYFETVFLGAMDKQVTWRVREAQGGSIDENGRYTAPNIPGIYEVIAESTAYEEIEASAFVVVKEQGR